MSDKTDDKSDKNESARPAEERNLEAAKAETGTGSGVEQPAPDQSPENVPAPTGEVRAVGVRHGMFGTKGSGTTPWSRAGDGRLTLKGAVREILATEMLEALGVVTSKSFALIETGEEPSGLSLARK